MTSAALVITSSRGDRRQIACGSLVTIGRVPPNDIALSADPKVSRNHALVRLMGNGRYYVIDLGSSNGTSVNGHRVMVPCELRDADTIRIGDTSLVFKCQVRVAAESGADPDAAGATQLTVGAAVQKMTILVADIRNFTGLNERLPPAVLARVMGHFFRDCTEAVERNGGVVDKFIGDAIMARWIVGAGGMRASVKSTLTAVVGMWNVVHALNRGYAELAGAFRIGCGINSGQAVLGNVGAGGTREYTALGDAVNIAFRLETASKELKKDVVLGQQSYDALPDGVWRHSLQNISVKNKRDPLAVWPVAFEDLDRILATI